MIQKIEACERAYLEQFCVAEVLENYIRYSDPKLQDMHSHHAISIDSDILEETVVRIIQKEINTCKQQGKKYLLVSTGAPVSQKAIQKLNHEFSFSEYLYYAIETEKYEGIQMKASSKVVKADNQKSRRDGRYADVIANYRNMTADFAIRRIERKFLVYDDPTKPLDLYVCYNGEEPVGNCELMLSEGIAKIEDFDVLDIYQRQGYGSQILRALLAVCIEHRVSTAYLVTDSDDTAKDMYLKTGFRLVGGRSEIMFQL